MTDIHAALGLSQLKKLEEFVIERNKIAHFYDKEFDKLGIKLQKLPERKFFCKTFIYNKSRRKYQVKSF